MLRELLRFTCLSLSLIGLITLCGCGRPAAETPPQSAPPAAVRLTRVRKGEATRSIILPANVLPFQQATLNAKVAGYAKTVSVDKGDSVKEGALLADIEVPELIE